MRLVAVMILTYMLLGPMWWQAAAWGEVVRWC
jgi:hypothetical protein